MNKQDCLDMETLIRAQAQWERDRANVMRADYDRAVDAAQALMDVKRPDSWWDRLTTHVLQSARLTNTANAYAALAASKKE